ncbi:pentatricopeptide repeat-containing protein At2g35130 [Capsella rubella]|uniref:pentatricopeptide repeat-containing protein At2g35130 n=1 Tax=Capsella rubella TaxID=81985 RepID=UPI000CD58467|nr:pentatricopeptide repeat-containing protein At2g35130 [Capsella rubella]
MLLLSAYSRARDVTKCEAIVKEMSENGVEPDTFVLNSMLNLYGRLGQFTKMEKILAEMENGPCTADISTYNILINVYGKAGFLERIEELFSELKERNFRPDVVTWTSRIGAYSRKKLYVKCLEIFEEMIDSGCAPDGGTAKVLLSACSSEDQVEQITSVLRTMHKVSSRSSKQLTSSDGHVQSSGGSTKALNIQWVVQMIEVAEGLMEFRIHFSHENTIASSPSSLSM